MFPNFSAVLLVCFQLFWQSYCFRVLPKHSAMEFMTFGVYNSSFVEDDSLWDKSHRRLVDAKYHLVDELPGLSEPFPSDHYAGLLPADDTGANMLFYWLFEAPEDALNKPLIIWLNGGPGCSSMDGLFLELGNLFHIVIIWLCRYVLLFCHLRCVWFTGPLRVNNGKVTLNPHSWHKMANIMFIDQPVGTGLSYSQSHKYASNDLMINKHFTHFLMEFFKVHPRYTTKVRLWKLMWYNPICTLECECAMPHNSLTVCMY